MGAAMCIIIAAAGFIPVVSGFIGGATFPSAPGFLHSRRQVGIRILRIMGTPRESPRLPTTVHSPSRRCRETPLTCIRMEFDFDSTEAAVGESLCFDYATQIPATSPVSTLHQGGARKGSAGYEPTYEDILIAKGRLKNSIKYTVVPQLYVVADFLGRMNSCALLLTSTPHPPAKFSSPQDCSKHESISKLTGVNVFFKKVSCKFKAPHHFVLSSLPRIVPLGTAFRGSMESP